ncbi:MAG: hypothetical protein GY835_13845 [bacterium]|nr:hypothetical protein [bacterium]
MKHLIAMLILLNLAAQPAVGAIRTDEYRPDEYGFDDGTFESFGTAADWADMAIGLFQVEGDCSVVVTTLRIYGFGDTAGEVYLARGADLDNAPGSLTSTGVSFSHGTSSSDEAGWIDIELWSQNIYFFPGETFAIGISLAGNTGIGLDDSCASGTCGNYWTRFDGTWRLEASSGRNIGMRLVAPGTCGPAEVMDIGTIKRFY